MRRDSNEPDRKVPAFFRKLAIVLACIALVGSAGCGVTSQSTGTTAQPSSSAQLSASSTSLNFGNVNVGNSTSQLVSLTNTGKTVVDIGMVTASGSGFSTSGGSNVALPPNQSVSIYVNFVPASEGAVTGAVSVSSNASNPVVRIALSGTGVGPKPQTHTVALSWSPSASQVIGYFVYRGNSSGGPYSRLNSSVDFSPSYTDTGLTAGNYYYVVTSIGSQNVESGYSNEVAVAVP